MNIINYEKEPFIELDKKFKNYTERDFEELLEKNARKIAKYLKINENDFVKIIKQKNLESIDKYIAGIHPDFIGEAIFNFEEFKNNKIKLGVTTGLVAKALQLAYIDKNQNPVVVQGKLITKDNKLVFGVRNKPEYRKNLADEPFDYKIMFCPAGYAKFNPNADLYESFYDELDEELNLSRNDVEKISIESQHEDIGFTNGIRITFETKVKFSFEELIKRWEKARHKWEYENLIGIECKFDELKRFIKNKNYSIYSKKAKGILEPSVYPVLKNFFKKYKYIR